MIVVKKYYKKVKQLHNNNCISYYYLKKTIDGRRLSRGMIALDASFCATQINDFSSDRWVQFIVICFLQKKKSSNQFYYTCSNLFVNCYISHHVKRWISGMWMKASFVAIGYVVQSIIGRQYKVPSPEKG